MTYWLLVGATQAYLYYQRYREGELRSAQLGTQLAQAQLQALRMQLHPHFLFNTLNAISTLVHNDPEAADRMIARLSELLRLTLENVGVQEVPLAQELEFLERYLEIERTRFADRLIVRMEIATGNARRAHPIPDFATSGGKRDKAWNRGALVGRVHRGERQAGGRHAGAGGLRRRAGNGQLCAAAAKDGVGISSTRARLEKLYGSAQRFELRNAEGGGVVATLAFPFRVSASSPSSEEGEAR